MATPIIVIIRFRGDPDALLANFEDVRQSWIGAQDVGYEPPSFYAAGRTDEGIAIVSSWHSAAAHRAFGEGMHAQIAAAGMPGPAAIERLRVEKLGWD